MKVAKLVYVSLLTRVIVDEDADEQTVMEEAIPRLSENIMDSPLQNIDKIVYDIECPYVMGEEYHLEVGDDVEMPDPKDDGSDSWEHGGFIGRIIGFYESNGEIFAQVEDGDSDVFDIDAYRLVEYVQGN
jgi:hypothetical protein